MFCPNCGANLEENAVFCSNCGSRIENTAAEGTAASSEEAWNNTASEAEQAVITPEGGTQGESASDTSFYQQKEKFHAKEFFKKNSRGIVGILVVLAVVILAIKLLGALFSGSTDSVIAVYDSKSGESAIYLNSKQIGTVEGNPQIYYNMEKSAFYILDGDDTAYYLKGKKLVKVMKDCEAIILANHDKTALLIDSDNELSRYNGSKLEEITDESVLYAAVSGDGSYYSYTIYDDDYVTYIGKKPGKETKVKDIRIGAISEKGDYMYGLDEDENLIYVNKKGDKQTIAKDIDEIVAFNADGTEVMFTDGSKTYVSVKGKDKVKVSSGTVQNVYGKKSDKIYSGKFYPASTFKKSVVLVSDGGDFDICLLSNKYEAEEIVSDISYICKVNESAEKIYYIEDSDLYYVKAKKGAKAKKLAEDVTSRIYISKDCKDIYFVNDDKELCYIRGTGKASTADEDLDIDLYSSAYVIDGKLYLISDDELYCVNGKKVKKLKNVEGVAFDLSADKVYAYDEDSLYEVKNSTLKKLKGDFEKIDSIRYYSNTYDYFY